jgi:hypothetical protein
MDAVVIFKIEGKQIVQRAKTQGLGEQNRSVRGALK